MCIKIPSTPESIVACQILEKSGINTLATCLFNLPQALAANQAGCQYIAPYFNGMRSQLSCLCEVNIALTELRVHFEPSTWKAYDDTFNEHPVIAIIGNIVEVYKTIGSKTLIMPARFVFIPLNSHRANTQPIQHCHRRRGLWMKAMQSLDSTC